MKIALTADLHFGSVPDGLPERLRDAIEAETPDLVVIAGDLTLGARPREFEAARNWVESLRIPTLVMPGNHDLSSWNLYQRFRDPFRSYYQMSGTDNLMPIQHVDGGLVLGFNTIRSWQPHLSWEEGVARRSDIVAAEHALRHAPASAFKAVAGHHPFVKVSANPRARPVLQAQAALYAFAHAGVELIMSGHTHLSFALEIAVANHNMVAIGAPTALSSRTRGEKNGFWIIDVNDRSITSTLWLLLQSDAFEPKASRTFRRHVQAHEQDAKKDGPEGPS